MSDTLPFLGGSAKLRPAGSFEGTPYDAAIVLTCDGKIAKIPIPGMLKFLQELDTEKGLDFLKEAAEYI